MSEPLDLKTIRADYETTLATLEVNSKPIINTLTMLAGENIQAATEIVDAIEQRIFKAEPSNKLPLFYLLDSILKNVGGIYIKLFSRNIVLLVYGAYTMVDERTQYQFIRLRNTWNSIFSPDRLREIDSRIEQQHQQHKARRNSETVHINPEFARKVKQTVAGPRPVFNGPRDPRVTPSHHGGPVNPRIRPRGDNWTPPPTARGYTGHPTPDPSRLNEYVRGRAPEGVRREPPANDWRAEEPPRGSPRPSDPAYPPPTDINRAPSPYSNSPTAIRGPPSPTPPMERIERGNAYKMVPGEKEDMSLDKKRRLMESQNRLLKQAHDQLSSGMLTPDQHKMLVEQLSQLYVVQQMQQQNKIKQGLAPGNLMHFVPLPANGNRTHSPAMNGPPLPTPPQSQPTQVPTTNPNPPQPQNNSTFMVAPPPMLPGMVVGTPQYGMPPFMGPPMMQIPPNQLPPSQMIVGGQGNGMMMPMPVPQGVSTAAPTNLSNIPTSNVGQPVNQAAGGGLNASQLFNQLVTLGIIKPKPATPSPVSATPVAKRPSFRQTDPILQEQQIPTIELKSQTLSQRNDLVITSLYSALPLQCVQCGLRFRQNGTDAMSDHMDWHFRVNRRDKEKLKKASSRKWYIAEEEWIDYKEIEAADEKAPAFFDLNTSEDNTEQQEPEVSCPVNMDMLSSDDNEECCAICGEKFEKFWNEDADAWHYRAAVRVDNVTYHHACARDAEKNGELFSDVVTPERRQSKEETEGGEKRKGDATTSSVEDPIIKKIKCEIP